MSNSIKLAALTNHSAICPEIGLFNTRWAEFVRQYHQTIPVIVRHRSGHLSNSVNRLMSEMFLSRTKVFVLASMPLKR